MALQYIYYSISFFFLFHFIYIQKLDGCIKLCYMFYIFFFCYLLDTSGRVQFLVSKEDGRHIKKEDE